MKEAFQWTVWLCGGGFAGGFLLSATAFFWCLPYMTSQSYCTGDAPFVGYMLVATSPFAILTGSTVSGVLLTKKKRRELMAEKAAELDLVQESSAAAVMDEQTPTIPNSANSDLPTSES